MFALCDKTFLFLHYLEGAHLEIVARTKHWRDLKHDRLCSACLVCPRSTSALISKTWTWTWRVGAVEMTSKLATSMPPTGTSCFARRTDPTLGCPRGTPLQSLSPRTRSRVVEGLKFATEQSTAQVSCSERQRNCINGTNERNHYRSRLRKIKNLKKEYKMLKDSIKIRCRQMRSP